MSFNSVVSLTLVGVEGFYPFLLLVANITLFIQSAKINWIKNRYFFKNDLSCPSLRGGRDFGGLLGGRDFRGLRGPGDWEAGGY